ncbi:hypothetical protein E4U10_000425, partial [Claviceps purpurea]
MCYALRLFTVRDYPASQLLMSHLLRPGKFAMHGQNLRRASLGFASIGGKLGKETAS